MRFAPIDLFVGLAKRTHAALHLLDEPEGHTSLRAPGTSTHGAFYTTLGHGAVTVGNFGFAHVHLPQGEIFASYPAFGQDAAGKFAAGRPFTHEG